MVKLVMKSMGEEWKYLSGFLYMVKYRMLFLIIVMIEIIKREIVERSVKVFLFLCWEGFWVLFLMILFILVVVLKYLKSWKIGRERMVRFDEFFCIMMMIDKWL